MAGGTQCADKAVSTEDLCVVSRDVKLEVARLEAMFNTLIENKVEAMKADKSRPLSNHSTPRMLEKRLQRITSSSTASSSHKENGPGHRHRHQRRHLQSRRPRHAKRNGESQQRGSSYSPESPRRYTHNHHHQHHAYCEHITEAVFNEEDGTEACNFLRYSEHAYSTTYDPESTACSCPDNHNGQIKLPFDDDYVSINIEDFENVEEDAIIASDALRRARRKRRKRRKKRKKKFGQQHPPIVLPVTEKVKVIDPDDLPQRARWTIVATACLLLLMCLLLVGVTLRMAPIIDDMGRGISRHRYSRRSQYSEYGSRQGSTRRKGSVHSEGRRSSVRSNRSRRNSCALERNKATTRTRKASAPIAPSPSVSASASASATALPTKPYVLTDLPYEDEDRARRHRIAVWLVLGSFIFIAFSSILIVVVTLTHQSELSFDENNTFKYYTFAVPSKLKPYIDSVRKENEELMNSLNRDSSGYNVSSVQASPP